MYHYKAPHDGVTRFSVKGLKHIDKLGKLISIEAYTVGSIVNGVGNTKWVDNKIRIIVRGENGSCTYGGFLWGYSGEGPHGLAQLFFKCGMSNNDASHYAFSSALGPNDMPLYGTKLYNATTLWKFQNSNIGWNLINIEKQVPKSVKFKKGQELICNYSIDKKPFKCTFIKYKGKDKAVIKYDIPLIHLYGIEDFVNVTYLSSI